MTIQPSALSTPEPHKTWRAWLILWVVVAGVEALLLANHAALDTLLWRSTRWLMGDQDAYSWNAYKTAHAADTQPAFYTHIDPPLTRVDANGHLEARLYKRTEKIWRVLRDLGEPLVTVILLAAVAIYDRRKCKAAIILLAATIAAGGSGWLIRVVAGRLRPNGEISASLQNEGDNYWQFFRGFHTGTDLAFPSGHATLAFATAAVLTYLSPKGRNLFLTIAAGCAISRVVMQAHFYSDILFGAAFGWTAAWWVAKLVDRALTPKTPI